MALSVSWARLGCDQTSCSDTQLSETSLNLTFAFGRFYGQSIETDRPWARFGATKGSILPCGLDKFGTPLNVDAQDLKPAVSPDHRVDGRNQCLGGKHQPRLGIRPAQPHCRLCALLQPSEQSHAAARKDGQRYDGFQQSETPNNRRLAP